MRYDWIGIRQWLIGRRTLLVTSACALITLGFGSTTVQAPSQTKPAEKRIAVADTVGRPRVIYEYSESQLGAIRAVIKTRTEFDHLWEVLRRDPSELPPKVDFSKEMLIVAGMGWEPDGGYRIAITSVRDTTHVLGVTVELGISTSTCTGGYAAVDHPAVVVVVPKSQSIAVFQDRVYRSCGR